jgi:hypothetical protein
MVRGPRATLRSDDDPPLRALLPADREGRHEPAHLPDASARVPPHGGRWLAERNLGVLNVIVVTTGRKTGRRREIPFALDPVEA